MPTGYTAPIKDGITFREYAMGCARAFGALITMRDEPADAEIPDAFEPSDYHIKAINKASDELKALSSMSADTAAAMAKEAYESEMKYHADKIREGKELEFKYLAMLEQVKNYKSPSPEHDNFREFMAKQITESIDFDCGSNYHYEAIKSAKLMTGDEWVVKEKERLEQSIAYHKKAHQQEVDATNKRNDWIQKLRVSLLTN